MADEEITLKFHSENKLLKKHIAIGEIIHKLALKPPPWLENFESPFKWGLSIYSMNLVSWDIPGKLCDYENLGAFYGFERLAFLLTLLFMRKLPEEEEKVMKEDDSDGSEEENALEEDEKASREEDEKAPREEDEKASREEDEKASREEDEKEEDKYDPETCYSLCRETIDEMAANEGDVMYGRIGPALEHVLQTTRAHMLFYKGHIAESQELARNIQPLEEMSEECKAGFEGLKAKCVMSMYQNYRIVLPYLHKAMELDPKFGYWPYLVGKVLRRARREFLEGSIEKEIQFFEKAVSLERNPKFLVFLGQAYQEKAMILKSLESRVSLDRLYHDAVELYRECWGLKNDSAAISRRIGNGMVKMRGEYLDKTIAKEALLKAVELSPNNVTHMSLGKFYYYYEMDDEKALEHFQKGHPGDFGTSEIIRLNLIKDPDFDPYDILLEWLKYEVNAVKQYRSYCDAVWYFLAYKGDVETAADYLWKVIKLDVRSIRAKKALEFRSYAFCLERPINLIELLVNEILLLKNRNERLPPEEKINMKLLEGYLQKFLEKYPDLGNINPRPNLVRDLKAEVNSIIASKRRQRYGFDNRRRESNRKVEPVNWRSNRPSEGEGSSEEVPHKQGEGNWEYKPWMSYRAGNSERNYTRNSVGSEDGERSRGYNRDDLRRNSESQSNWRTLGAREGSSGGFSRDDRRRHSESQYNSSTARNSDFREGNGNQNSTRMAFNSRGRNDRQYSSYNNNRYDVTITDWRRENREK